MAKKTSYNEMSAADLAAEIAKLRTTLREHAGKNRRATSHIAEYRVTRKNIARALTAQNALPAVDKA